MFSGAPDRAPLPGDSRVPLGVNPSASPAGALPFDSSTSISRGPTLGDQALFFWCILARSLGFCIASDLDYLLIYQDSLINFFAPFPVSSI